METGSHVSLSQGKNTAAWVSDDRFNEAISFLSSGNDMAMTVNWLHAPELLSFDERTRRPENVIHVTWNRPIRRIHLRRYLAKLRHELQSPEAKRLERATRVRPLRKKIKRFK